MFEISLRLISYDKNEQLALNIRDLGGKESNNSILSSIKNVFYFREGVVPLLTPIRILLILICLQARAEYH